MHDRRLDTGILLLTLTIIFGLYIRWVFDDDYTVVNDEYIYAIAERRRSFLFRDQSWWDWTWLYICLCVYLHIEMTFFVFVILDNRHFVNILQIRR